MKAYSLGVYVVAVVVALISLWATSQFTPNEWVQILIATPFPIALLAILYQIFKDNTAHERQRMLQNENNDFILSATSHMANVAFDKHAEFSEKYLKVAEEELEKLFTVGPASDETGSVARDAVFKLFEVRREFGPWVTKKIREELEPFEQELLKIYAREGLVKSLPVGKERSTVVQAVATAYKILADVKEPGAKNEAARGGAIQVKESLQIFLGIPDLTELRNIYVTEALRRQKSSKQQSSNLQIISFLLVVCIPHVGHTATNTILSFSKSNEGPEIIGLKMNSSSNQTTAKLPTYQSDADRKLLGELREKAEKGDPKAQFGLGAAFDGGKLGLAKDVAEAVRWYRKAAEQNHAGAQFNLGICCDLGQGVAKNDVEAVNWYRKAAEQNLAPAQYNLGVCYAKGQGVAKNVVEAVKWYRKAAEQNLAQAEDNLGFCYDNGQGVAKDQVEAAKWYRKAAEQNHALAQSHLGFCYDNGQGVAKDQVEAVKWYRRAAEQNHAPAQFNLGVCYDNGDGVVKDYVEAYKWWLLAAGQGYQYAKKGMAELETVLTREQIAEGQKMARNFKSRNLPSARGDRSSAGIANTLPESSGSGFFITEDGYFITNEHVAGNGAQVRLVTAAGLISAKVVKVDAANDLALLKAEGQFAALPVAASRAVKLGGTVATVGFPNIGLQGFAPKLAKGEIASLSGAGDDARYFQISVPVQPGNSGGALVDERGNVVGVVAAKLSARAALAASGSLPENVNYAVKSSYLLGFLESVPEVSAKLKEPNTKEMKFEDVVKAAEQAAVLVLVY